MRRRQWQTRKHWFRNSQRSARTWQRWRQGWLALVLHASLVVVDDRTATDLGFVTTGTLGVLERAARMRLVDFDQAIVRLRATSFWVRESTIEEIRRRLRAAGR